MVNHFEEIEKMLDNIERKHYEHYKETLRMLNEIEKQIENIQNEIDQIIGHLIFGTYQSRTYNTSDTIGIKQGLKYFKDPSTTYRR